MNRLRNIVLVCLLGLGGTLSAQTPRQQPTAPPDNTRVNKGDHGTRATADQQKNNGSDVEITRQIRRSIIQDKSLSTYAKNVKVITQNGNVILRGPVRSEEEKALVETKANDVAGASHVKSEIQIAAKQPGQKTH